MDAPASNPQGWHDTFNETFVRFTDRDHKFQESSVAYRDRGDAYVTRVVDLSADLDQVYATLMDFQADGGGDGPESVNQALQAAVRGISWSQDPGTYKAVFLVGDAPPHMDYPDDIKYPTTLKVAVERGIRVNAVQSGQAPATAREWQRIAQLGGGQYFQVDQTGSAVALATPYDACLAELSGKLDQTRLYYGHAGVLHRSDFEGALRRGSTRGGPRGVAKVTPARRRPQGYLPFGRACAEASSSTRCQISSAIGCSVSSRRCPTSRRCPSHRLICLICRYDEAHHHRPASRAVRLWRSDRRYL